jgi:hypothetical protein
VPATAHACREGLTEAPELRIEAEVRALADREVEAYGRRTEAGLRVDHRRAWRLGSGG